MTTEKELLERGYTRCRPSPVDGDCVTDLYQKRFSDENGIKYYINVKRWDLNLRSGAPRVFPPTLEYEMQLYQAGTHYAVNIVFFNNWALADVEEYAEWMFSSGRFDYYDRNGG